MHISRKDKKQLEEYSDCHLSSGITSNELNVRDTRQGSVEYCGFTNGKGFYSGNDNDTNNRREDYLSQLLSPTLINSYNFLLMFLNNYLDCATFHMTKFLVSIYYLNINVPSSLSCLYHLESRLHTNHQKFMNKHFYCAISASIGRETLLGLGKSYMRKIIKLQREHLDINRIPNRSININHNNGINRNNNPNFVYSDILNTLPFSCNYNVYDNIEDIFKKKKNLFSLENTLNFILIYSLNKFYYSTIYYDMSKYLSKFDLTHVSDNVKMLLFFLFFQCIHVYKPFYFLLLYDILTKWKKNLGKMNLYILCSLILILIKESKIKMKSVIYKKRKFGKIAWNFFFPLDIFIHKNIMNNAEKKVRRLEKNILSKKADIKGDTCIKEQINTAHITPFLFTINQFKNHFKNIIPQIVEQYKHYYKNGKSAEQEYENTNVKEEEASPHNSSFFFYFDNTIESEVFKTCLNFLSYEYVTAHFLLPKKSLYYDILLHLKNSKVRL
ncbi:hypothetical protein MKS88_001089 [Plasmodium brasilianum]|nr:hypothetical protein MKS88_001089 [Plasmodium brasilianum]SBS82264.1 conserved Plasmodium protein, unknown function [Plasmodium malariae]